MYQVYIQLVDSEKEENLALELSKQNLGLKFRSHWYDWSSGNSVIPETNRANCQRSESIIQEPDAKPNFHPNDKFNINFTIIRNHYKLHTRTMHTKRNKNEAHLSPFCSTVDQQNINYCNAEHQCQTDSRQTEQQIASDS